MSTRTRSTTSASSSDYDHPWRDPDVLRELYCDQELSLRDVAEILDCHHSTIGQWLDRCDIQAREAVPPEETWFEPGTHPHFWTSPEGYRYAVSTHSGERNQVSMHGLSAIAGGADPYRVFADGTHVHHRLHKLDTPATVEVLDADDHLRRHGLDDFEPPSPSELFGWGEDDCTTDRH